MASENLNYDQITTILEALYDTFNKYLQPSVVAQYMKDALQDDYSDGSDFLHMISEKELVDQFVQALLMTQKDECRDSFLLGLSDFNNQDVKQYCELLVELITGKLFDNISTGIVQSSLVALEKARMISLSSKQKLESLLADKKTPPHEVCLRMFTEIKRGKHDWPFVFFDAVKNWSKSQGDNPVEQGPGDQKQLPASFSVFSELQERDIPADCYASMNCEDLELFNQTKVKELHVTRSELNNPVFQHILGNGGLDPKQVQCDYSAERIREQLNWKGYHSDSEEQDQEEIKKAEATFQKPDLQLREYQKELAANALDGRNTIICAPTGCGKTRVATHIVSSHLENDDSSKPKKIAFLARTVPLVLQQCKSLETYLSSEYRITSVTGESEHSMKMHMLLDDNDIIVMTPKILENHLIRNYLENLGVFSLIIFDECHHTREGEPYNTLMLSYLKTKKNSEVELPQIVGLTASIGIEDAGNVDGAVENILKVCGNMDCDNISAVKENLEELKEVVPVPQEVSFGLREREGDRVVKKIESIMKKLENDAHEHAQDVKNVRDWFSMGAPANKKSQQYNQWAVKLKNAARSVPISRENRETNLSVRSLIIISDYLTAYNVALETYDLVQLIDVMANLKKSFTHFQANERRCTGEDIYFKYFEELQKSVKNRELDSNKNLEMLASLLDKHLIKKGAKSRGIIFVKTRAMADALKSWLRRCRHSQLRALNALTFTGAGASADEGGMTQAEQDAVIQRFQSGETRLLVSTSVAEEGLDIPECNLVIKYNHVGNEVTTVQTRGRSRKHGGLSILLAMDKVRQKETINQGKAKLMKKAIEKIRDMPKEEIGKKIATHQEWVLQTAEIQDMMKARREHHLKDDPFSLVCRLCRKVTITSEDIKIINDAHRVNVDRALLDKIKVWPYDKARPVDDARLLGSIRCQGEPETGKFCFQHLGSMMIHAGTPFVVLAINQFGFDVGDTELEFYKKWKDVPYKLGHIEVADIARYLPDIAPQSRKADSGFQDNETSKESAYATEGEELNKDERCSANAQTSNKEISSNQNGKGNETGPEGSQKQEVKPPGTSGKLHDRQAFSPPQDPPLGRRDSFSSSTNLKTVHPAAETGTADSGHYSGASEPSETDSTEVKEPLVAGAYAAPRRLKEEFDNHPDNVSNVSDESQTKPLSINTKERSVRRVEDFRWFKQIKKNLDSSPKLDIQSLYSSSVQSKPALSSVASEPAGSCDDISVSELLISKSLTSSSPAQEHVENLNDNLNIPVDVQGLEGGRSQDQDSIQKGAQEVAEEEDNLGGNEASYPEGGGRILSCDEYSQEDNAEALEENMAVRDNPVDAGGQDQIVAGDVGDGAAPELNGEQQNDLNRVSLSRSFKNTFL
ncbi:uncharacterized protein LOC101853474 [Aplysia californica]|uniref:RNA helicase n=1 Tax=Aplysia californica TaxID=6500 RepID=A0ABM0JW10_APLCA|nr:uncharacterized protein LOC101853474 [Aplysia californica]